MDIDEILQDLGGCGRFQIYVTTFVSLIKMVTSLSFIFMAFGNYNPGWTCLDLDNNSTSAAGDANGTTSTLPSFPVESNVTDECTLYDQCANVQFAPGVSSVVTEWHLVCDKAWVSPVIISIQMVGMLIGSLLSGYLGDRFGRKRTLCGVMFFNVLFQVISFFSNSWYMFAGVRFCVGFIVPMMCYIPVVLNLEYVQYKWRPFVMSLPNISFGSIIFALSAWATQDWRWLHAITAIGSFLVLIILYWMPDSLRWLVIKDKMEDATAIVKTIAKMNRAELNDKHDVEKIATFYRSQPKKNKTSYLYFLRKDFRYPTIVIGITCSTMCLVYYAISFGITSLPGNFYASLVIISCSDIPMALVSATLPNCIGRKRAMAVFLLCSSLTLFFVVAMDLGTVGGVHTVGVVGGTIVSRMCVEAAWDVVITYTGEFYPTVVRSTSVSYTSLSARFGCIVAPYLIPTEPEKLYISFLTMASLLFLNFVIVLFLPEIKGEAMQDIWEVGDKDKTETSEDSLACL